jgi:hypothetical protein
MNPSFYAHVINGSLLFLAFIMFFKNYAKIRNIDPYKLIEMTLLFSLATGVHGLSHMGLEQIYNYNPVQQINQIF